MRQEKDGTHSWFHKIAYQRGGIRYDGSGLIEISLAKFGYPPRVLAPAQLCQDKRLVAMRGGRPRR
jgi:hypothetical protein